jgi:ribosome biogenesis GTPase
VAEGRLDPARLESYLRLQDELAFLARQQDERAQLDEKRRARKTTTSRRPRRKGSVPS